MIRWLVIFLVLAVMTQAAFAVYDPRSDVMGVYFDDLGEQICEDDIVFYDPFSVWIVYTNPSVPFIQGFEVGYHTTTQFLMLGYYPPCGIIWIDPPEWDNISVACGEPFPTAEATPLLRIDYMVLGYESPESIYYLEKASGSNLPGDNPYVLLPDGTFLETPAGVPAYTTLCCGVPTEKRVWGSIKSLYR